MIKKAKTTALVATLTAAYYLSWAACACSDKLTPALDPIEESFLGRYNSFYEPPL